MIHGHKEEPCAQNLPLQLELLGKEQHFKSRSNKVTVRRAFPFMLVILSVLESRTPANLLKVLECFLRQGT